MTKHTINLNENAATSESQKLRILEFILTGCGLTQLQALNYFGCFRLPARISELRENGWPIRMRMIEVETIYGKKHVAQYYL